MEFQPSLNNRLICILILIWLDIGMTYIALDRYESINRDEFQVNELSITASPFIQYFGLGIGIVIAGLINTILILFIALFFRGPVEHGILMGIFIVAIMLNFRLWQHMGEYI